MDRGIGRVEGKGMAGMVICPAVANADGRAALSQRLSQLVAKFFILIYHH
jgi:hypothetical protein